MSKPSPREPHVFSGCWEIDHENRTEYRGAVFRVAIRIDVCCHRHRSPEAARSCGKKLLREWNKRNG